MHGVRHAHLKPRGQNIDPFMGSIIGSPKTGFYGFWMKIGQISNFSPKILGICDFNRVFG